MAVEIQLTTELLVEGQNDNIVPLPMISSEIAQPNDDNIDKKNIEKNDDDDIEIIYNEGQISICKMDECEEMSVNQCCKCNENICSDHCSKVDELYECTECIANRELEEQRNINRRNASCCIKRIIARLLIFAILIIIACIYSAHSDV